MANASADRHSKWRRRLALKASIFDDLNAERAARIRQAFPGDERPEVRAVVEFFANYPRCQNAPAVITLQGNKWDVVPDSNNIYEAAAAVAALSEMTSLTVLVQAAPLVGFQDALQTVRDEVAEMRALGLWGRS